MILKTIYEKNLLGSLGTLLKNRLLFKNKTGILIHGDNYTNADLNSFLLAHISKPKECLITMLTFKTSNPESCGIVETNKDGIMINFHEKVKNPPSNIANGAVYLFDYCFIEWLEQRKFKGNDFSLEVLPLLKGKVQTWHTNSDFLDVGTPKALDQARRIFLKKLS